MINYRTIYNNQNFTILFSIYRSLDCESSESHTTATETSEPETKKYKTTEE